MKAYHAFVTSVLLFCAACSGSGGTSYGVSDGGVDGSIDLGIVDVGAEADVTKHPVGGCLTEADCPAVQDCRIRLCIEWTCEVVIAEDDFPCAAGKSICTSGSCDN